MKRSFKRSNERNHFGVRLVAATTTVAIAAATLPMALATENPAASPDASGAEKTELVQGDVAPAQPVVGEEGTLAEDSPLSPVPDESARAGEARDQDPSVAAAEEPSSTNDATPQAAGKPGDDTSPDANHARSETDAKPAEGGAPSITYATHVQDEGWQNPVRDGQMAGTEGRGLRLEGLVMGLDLAGTDLEGQVRYATHVQDIGWQDPVADGQLAGTEGKSLRLEGVRVWLEGPIADSYDIYYHVHIQDFGWMDWACNGDLAGSVGLSKRLEGIEVRLVAKGEEAPGATERPCAYDIVSGRAHVQNLGWTDATAYEDGIDLGTTGQSLRLEAIALSVPDVGIPGEIRYNVHVQDIGWLGSPDDEESWSSNGKVSGTEGQSLRIEAVQVDLEGELAERYDVCYRAHVENVGWMDWAVNGQMAGTAGYGQRLEALQVRLVPKGDDAPGPAYAPYDEAGHTVQLVLDVTSPYGVVESSRLLKSAVDARNYGFLPSYADAGSVVVRATDDETGMLVSGSRDGDYAYVLPDAGIDLATLGAQQAEGGWLLFAKPDEASSPQAVLVLRSANVRSAFLYSDNPVSGGRAFVEASPDHSASATGMLRLYDPAGDLVYDDALTQIKGRGNTTWEADKKPYQLKLATKADLLGTGDKANESKTWLLLANAYDPTLLGNSIACNLGLELGLKGTQSEPIDLWYDGEYRGSYLLSEKVQVGSGRVDIPDLQKAIEQANPYIDLKSRPLITRTNRFGQKYQFVGGLLGPIDNSGGYLLEKDDIWYASEPCWFQTTIGTFVVKSPEYATRECVRRISEDVQEAIDNLEADTAHGTTFDLASFADTLLVNDLMRNWDYCVSSTYFYKPADEERVYAGPLWDFDRTLGETVADPDEWKPTTGHTERPQTEWAVRTLLRYDETHDEWLRLSKLMDDVLLGDAEARGTYLRSLDGYRQRIRASQAMDNALWGPLDYDARMDWVEGWLRERYFWMGTQY